MGEQVSAVHVHGFRKTHHMLNGLISSPKPLPPVKTAPPSLIKSVIHMTFYFQLTLRRSGRICGGQSHGSLAHRLFVFIALQRSV